MWQLPGVVVVLVDMVVVCEPPATVGVVTLVLEDVVAEGGEPGVEAIVVVLEVEVDGGVVVCARESGMANVRLTQSAPAANRVFMRHAPGRKRPVAPTSAGSIGCLATAPSRAGTVIPRLTALFRDWATARFDWRGETIVIRHRPTDVVRIRPI